MGEATSFVPFIVLLALSTVYVAVELPETRGRPIGDIVAGFLPKAKTVETEDPNAPLRAADQPSYDSLNKPE